VQPDPSAGLRQTAARDNITGVQSLSAYMTYSWHFPAPLL
jgi:hypothetical protein